MTKAIGEAIERYCSANYWREGYPIIDYKSASFPCIKPEDFTLYTAKQYGQPGFPFVPFDGKTRVRWVPALNLHTEETASVPAAMVFLGYTPDKQVGEQNIAPQISTGLSCHTNPKSAALAAICEVIERDAVAITWQARLSRPTIRLTTLSPRNQDLVERLKRPGTSISLLLLAMDHPVPVIFAIMTSQLPEAPAMLVAAAAHLDPEQAVQKSLEELAQIWSFAQRIKVARPKFLPDKGWANVMDPTSHAAVYFDHANVHLAEFLFASNDQIAFGDIKNLSTQNPSRDLRLVVEKIHDMKWTILVADVTSDDIRDLGLFVLRAVIPGFHPLFMGHRFRALGGTRLWEIPQRLGYPGITPERGDNPFPHPFA
jgi:ribosomal protein S12 methylthiotransferase accessory factor